jgi:hypothetical protein
MQDEFIGREQEKEVLEKVQPQKFSPIHTPQTVSIPYI